MNWTGKSSVFFVTVFALAIAGLFAAPAQAEVLASAAGDEAAFFYSSFPIEGGPHIIAATFWDAESNDTTYTGEQDSLFVVFNEPVNVGTIAIEDFVFHGFEAATLERIDGVTGKMAVLTDLDSEILPAIDSVGVVWSSFLGTDGSDNKDVGMVPVTEGPVIVDITYHGNWDASNVHDPIFDPDSITVIFDHPVTIADATGLFTGTPEFINDIDNTASGRLIGIAPAAAADTMLQIYTGISKLWLAAGDVEWTADDDLQNAMAQKVAFNNDGPVLMAAYYNDGGTGATGTQDDDEIWLVFDQPVPAGSLQDVDDQYSISWQSVTYVFSLLAEQRRQPQGNFYSNVIVITNPVTADGDPAIDAEMYVVPDYAHIDYQGVEGPMRMSRCKAGVGISRAAYFDRGTDDADNDQLHLWFSQELALADVTALDFELVPDVPDFWSEITFQVDNTNGFGHVVVSGINNSTALGGARLPNGYYVKIATDTSIEGLVTTTDGCDGESLIPIMDDSEPARVRLAEVPSLTYKRYNSVTDADTAFIAWRETGLVDDSDQYFVFFTNQPGTDLDDLFIDNYRQSALVASNLTPVTVNGSVMSCAVDIEQGNPTTDGHAIVHGDELYFMLVPATFWGNMADGDEDAVLKFTTPIIAGPVCPPRDFDENDDDIIHVTGVFAPADTSWTRSMFGDANALPCGTHVFIFDGDDPLGSSIELGTGPVNPNGSFDPVVLGDPTVDPDTLQAFFVFAWQEGAFSDSFAVILNDIALPSIVDGSVMDLFNPYQIYKGDDYVNIIMQADDATGDPASPTTALSDLLEVWADMTFIDNRTALPTSLGSFELDSIPMWSMGSDEIDNDGDWVAHDPLIDLDDDGVMDFPEPFFDENGNGYYNAGETFVDRDGDDLCDAPRDPLETPPAGSTDYDLNLDSADEDEHGWYEIRLLASGDEDLYNDVVRGFQVLDTVTDSTGTSNFGEIDDLPAPFGLRDVYIDATTELDEHTTPFICELDEVAPTVAKITEFYTAAAFLTAADPADNVILPTNPVYHMGRYLDVLMETHSDNDVLFSVAQIKESSKATWEHLTLDPAGWNADADTPGVAGFDDDRDVALMGYDTDGIDNDDDGEIDEPGEGIDFQDPEVVDASQDSTADANAVNPDLIYRTTDRIDNDNDAFYVFEPYWDVGGGAVYHRIIWFNIDETRSNDIDDDFDGVPDDNGGGALGTPEDETYSAISDDNEDGIVDAEAIELIADGGTTQRFFCVADSAYSGPFYVAAPYVLGDAPDGMPSDVINDIRGLTDFRGPSYGILDANGGAMIDPPAFPWGDSTTAAEFNWYLLHGDENIDFWHLAQIMFGTVPDGSEEYDLRIAAYDQAGNVQYSYAAPITFTSDVTDPVVQLEQCADGDTTICEDAHLDLTTTDDDDAVKIFFEARFSTDEGTTWSDWGADWAHQDESRPYTAAFDSLFVISNDPPDDYVLAQFRAYGEDEFGNVQDPDSTCVFEARIEDCRPPVTWFTLIHETMNTHPAGDHMNIGDTANPYYYRDVIGPLQVPVGETIDVWALFAPDTGMVATYDHDVIRVVLEYRPAGAGDWTMLETIEGDVIVDEVTGDTLSVDLTLPVAVTLNTAALETGSYDLRVWACDIEGNCNTTTYDIAMITVVDEGLRAYIEPPYRENPTDPFELYALNWIHDYDLEEVEFEFYEDLNGNGEPDDAKTEWVHIATDIGSATDLPGSRGDVTLYRGADMIFDLEEGTPGFHAFRGYTVTGDSAEAYIDYDGDGYSERDPIILDADEDMWYTPGNDIVLLGDGTEILGEGLLELTAFEDTEFRTGDFPFDATQWIFRENLSPNTPAQGTGMLNLWHVQWDVTGLEGDFLVRAKATDILYNIDEDRPNKPIPWETLSIDTEPPVATITELTYPDASAEPAIDGIYINGQTGWFGILAECSDADVEHVQIEFRIPGHAELGDWTPMDVNDDNDFYADIDGIPGFSDEDEIILDDGDFVFDESKGDLVLYKGANGEINTPAGTPLLPLFNVDIPGALLYLVEEDDNGDDDDNDGMTDEDIDNPEDRIAPYFVYMHIGALHLISDTNVELRAVATDQSANADPNPAVLQLVLGETNAPETDVVWVKMDDELIDDVFPSISDGDGVYQFVGGDDEITVMTTGEDATAIENVDLMWRRAPECVTPMLYEWDNPWQSMADGGYTTANTSYDYPFDVNLAQFLADNGSGVYEFYVEATDNNGNATPPYENPNRFRLLEDEATIVTDLTDVWVEPAHDGLPGSELWFEAEVVPANEDATVAFLYAERVLDVEIDPTRVTPHPEHATYMTMDLVPGIFGDPADHAVLTIDDVEYTFYEDADALILSGDATGWTYDAGDDVVEFLAIPGTEAEILVSYNITGYDYLWQTPDAESTDDEPDVSDGYYAAAWDQPHGGVPEPDSPYTVAYDIIATLYVGAPGDEDCGLMGEDVSEGQYVMLLDEEAPHITLFAQGLRNADLDAFWPGNPSFDSWEGTDEEWGGEEGRIEWKLSGIEHEFFVAEGRKGKGEADSDILNVNLVFEDEAGVVTSLPMEEIPADAEYVEMTFTLYESDFPEVLYGFENVGLNFNGLIHEMTPTDGVWQVSNVPVPTGTVTSYTFMIDQDGNDWDEEVLDPRNWEAMIDKFMVKGSITQPGADNGVSSISVPFPPFWFVSGPDFGTVTSVWEVYAEAFDDVGNRGVTEMNVKFVYDPVAPSVDEVTASSTRFGAGDTVMVYATITDPPAADFDVITVAEALFQYCPNYTAVKAGEGDPVWLEFGAAIDTNRTDGWSMQGTIPDPEMDGFDNDGDGTWDEADESTSMMAFRVLALDDGHNYSDPADANGIREFTLDETEPAAVLTSPGEGLVYPYGSTITLTAEITEYEEIAKGTDIHHVLFQFDKGDGFENVDITPEDGSDADFDVTEPYEVMFNTADYLGEEDSYIRFRAVAADYAGNEDHDPAEVLVIVNDITGPEAYPMWAKTTGATSWTPLTDAHVALHGPEAMLKGVVVDPAGWEHIATVTVQYTAPAKEDWVTIAVIPAGDLTHDAGDLDFYAEWETVWDTHPLPEGLYTIRAIAADVDANADEAPLTQEVAVDHTPPAVLYEPIAGYYDGFAPWAWYYNDGVVDQQSMVLTPDPATGDLAFMVITPDADIAGITLEWHQDGTHALGEWAPFAMDMFDYEPNLTFDAAKTTYYVWWLPLDNFRDHCELVGISGVMDIRGLATDYAGNANILYDANNLWKIWTVDVDDPTAFDFNHDLTNPDEPQVESGEPVTFEFVLADTTTDVVTVRLEYREAPEVGVPPDWEVIDPNPATEEIEPIELTVVDLDTPYAMWHGTATWETPYPLVQDTDYDVRVVFYDSAHNWDTSELTITVEDNIKPVYTKIWAVPAEVTWLDDWYAGTNDMIYGTDCESEIEKQGTGGHDALFIDMDDDGDYTPGDVAIDYGAFYYGASYALNGQPFVDGWGTIGDPGFTWPRYIDEIVLGGELGEQVMVSHTVTLVARTQIDDIGLERVEFYAITPAGDTLLVDTDECVPAYGMGNYLWHVIWDTKDLDDYGEPLYPDGVYTIVPIAYDLEGNVEEWGAKDMSGHAVVTVDNTAPQATPDADPYTEGVQPSITVERNSFMTLFATTDVDGIADDEVTFYYKRATDLNRPDAWTMVQNAWGVDASDVNPDKTRPYVFDWDFDMMDVPFPLVDPVVGVDYHVACDAADLLVNTEDKTDAFEDDRYITFTVVDTKAPVATITGVRRATGDNRLIQMPHLDSPVHARDFWYLMAEILEGDNDVERVEFMWALPGEAPQLIDADVTRDPENLHTWRIYDWDLRALAGQTIEVFAVATDDVGHTDFDSETGRPIQGPIFTVFVDFDAPTITMVTPWDDMKECRSNWETDDDIYELIFTSTATDIDEESVVWEWKFSGDPDLEENWTVCYDSGNAVFDASTGTFADVWDIDDDCLESNFYDVRLTLYDDAGNMYQAIVAVRIVIDVDDPWGEVTRVVVNEVDYFPTQVIEITLGDVITLWATADDIEEGLPGFGTGVEEILFQAQYATGKSTSGEWRDVGLWQAPDDTIYEHVVTSVDWNTSGLSEGYYHARIVIHDEECNEYTSAAVDLQILDRQPPRARIAGWDPCELPHGDDPPVYCDVYAIAYCDDAMDEVQFQYSEDAGETWVPFGLSDDDANNMPTELCDIWSSRLELGSFEVGDELLLRAIARDCDMNQDPNPPVAAVKVYEHPDGSLDLVPIENEACDEISEPTLSVVGGECPTQMIVTVQTNDASVKPHVLYVHPDTWDWNYDPIGYCSNASCIYMERMIDDPTIWRGVLDLPVEDCGKITVFANALGECEQIDIHSTYVWSRYITNALGTNGVHWVPGYVAADTSFYYLNASAYVPSGSGVEACLLLAPGTDAPTLSADQARFMTMLERTNYYMNPIAGDNDIDFNDGYYLSATIDYDDAALIEAAGSEERAAAIEPYLTVRLYDTAHEDFGHWEGTDITHITVDAQANRVSFMTNELECADAFYALFAPTWDAPVAVLSFTPDSPYPGRWNYTDRDPIIIADLNTTGIEEIDSTTVEIWIGKDGEQQQLVAAWMPDGGDPDNDPDHWARGDGELVIRQKNLDGTMFEVTYYHTTQQPWWLEHGWHTLNIMYKTDDGVDEWVELPAGAPGARFFVDADPPIVEFHGGWTDNPVLHNVSGYLNPAQMENMLTVYFYDDDAGLLVRPTDIECDDCEECDCNLRGIKYDLWLVHDEDDQVEIDEIEERLLLHSGTADELIPYMIPPYHTPSEVDTLEGNYYTPDDTLIAGLPIMAGGVTHDIGDGDVIEVVIYSKKRIEQYGDYTEGCEGGLIIVPNTDGVQDTLGTFWLDCYVDHNSRMHIYEQGVLDWAGNAGSEYVEQRFIVDMTAPTVELISPAGGFTEPSESFCFEAQLVDAGSGGATAEVVMMGPDGAEIEITDFEIAGDIISGCVEGGLDMGRYSLVVTAADMTGNTAVVSVPIIVESRTLAMSETYIYPNPVNPDDYEAIIHFNLSRHAEITAKVYDFAGEYVTTIASHEPYAAGVWSDLRWAGQASDGTELANGAYLIRLEAFDGSARKAATIKAVIWRE